MEKVEAYNKAWRLGVESNDFSLVDKIYHLDFKAVDAVSGVEVNIDAFKDKNIAILGMSKDSVKRQKNFATKQEFPYPLLSDEPGDVVQAYGCWGRKKFMGREFDGILRKSFLIDENGHIERIYEKVKTKTHGTDVLADL